MTDILSNEAARYALLLLLFVAVAGVAFAVVSILNERGEVRERLASGVGTGDDGVQMGAGLRTHDARGAWIKLVTAIEKTGLPLVDTKDATLRSRLVAAGYTQESAPRIYSLVRLVTVIGLPVGTILLIWASGSTPSLTRLYIIGLIAALLGLYLPSVWIRA